MLQFLAAQPPGTITVARPDSTRPRPHILWIGVERYNGLENIGQFITPWTADKDQLHLYDGWGATIRSKASIPVRSGRGMIHTSLVSGITAFHSANSTTTWSTPLAYKVGASPFNNIFITGTIGGRYFYPGGDAAFSGRARLEYGGGLGFNLFRILYPRSTRRFAPSCWPFLEIEARVIDKQLFSYFQVEIPFPRFGRAGGRSAAQPDPLNR